MEQFGNLLLLIENEGIKEQISALFEIGCSGFDRYCGDYEKWQLAFIDIMKPFGKSVQKAASRFVKEHQEPFFRYGENSSIDNVVWEEGYLNVCFYSGGIVSDIEKFARLLDLLPVDDIRFYVTCDANIFVCRRINGHFIEKVITEEHDLDSVYCKEIHEWFHEDLSGIEPFWKKSGID